MHQSEFMAASSRCYRIPQSRAGLVQLNYQGIVSARALDRIRSSALEGLVGAPALVVRTDTALMTMRDVPLIMEEPGKVPPAALVVRKEMRDLWVEYARQLAELGITRAVFLDSQLEQAYRWAERRAEESVLLWLPEQPDRR